MITRTLNIFLLAALASILSIPAAIADSPKSIDKPDRHSVEVKGKINLYRVQVEGMQLGEGKNKSNSEVFITLDSSPKTIYALAIHGDSPQSNRVIADTLRDAYVNNLPVTLYHQMSMTQDNNYKILMVQMSR